MIELHCEQRTEEWYKARIGVITASACGEFMSAHKRRSFAFKKLAEMLTGESESFKMNEYMQWGIDTEDEARIAYEKLTGNSVQEIGFVFKDESRRVGCSPDGLVGDDGLVEIKCPMTKTHLGYIESGPPKKYKDQMNFQMYCTGRKWCDFVSYDPRVKDPKLRIYTKRLEIDIPTLIEIDDGVQYVTKTIDKFLTKHKVEV